MFTHLGFHILSFRKRPALDQKHNYTARVTLPERRQRVQALTRQGVPLTNALTRWTLGFQVRLDRLCEWDTLIPNVTPLPQMSHFAILCTSFCVIAGRNFSATEKITTDILPDICPNCNSFFLFFIFHSIFKDNRAKI